MKTYTNLPPKYTTPIINTNSRVYFHIKNIRSNKRIGPQNLDGLSVIIGSLLGDGYSNKRSWEWNLICNRQSLQHKEYLFWLYEFFHIGGYTSDLQPRQCTKTIKSREVKQYYGYEFNTFTFSIFGWIHSMFYKVSSARFFLQGLMKPG